MAIALCTENREVYPHFCLTYETLFETIENNKIVEKKVVKNHEHSLDPF